MGKTECDTKVTFEKNEFHTGEKTKCKVIVDNTKCKKDVESVAFTLHRHYSMKDNNGNISVGSRLLKNMKGQGVKAGEKVEKTMFLDIPQKDNMTH